jgi:hypothetical protein
MVELETLNAQVRGTKVDDVTLSKVNLASTPELLALIGLVPNPVIQSATLEFAQLLEEEGLIDTYRTEKKDVWLRLFSLRINGYQQYQLKKVLQLSDDELFAHSLEILAPLPLYAVGFTKSVQRMALPLFLRTDKGSVRGAVSEIASFLTVAIPLHQQIQGFVEALKGGREDVNAELQAWLQSQAITLDLCKSVTPKKQAFYNIGLLYAEAHRALDGELYTREWLDRMGTRIYDSLSAASVLSTAQVVIVDTIAAAIRKNCYQLEILQRIREICESLRLFIADRSPANKRAVAGHVLLLPPELKPFGEISQHWIESLAFAIKETYPILEPAMVDYLTVLGTTHTSVYDALEEIPLDPFRVAYTRAPGDEERVVKHRHIHTHKHHDEHSAPIVKPPPPPPRTVRRVIKVPKKPEPVIVRKVVREVVKIKKKVPVIAEPSEDDDAVMSKMSTGSIRAVKIVETGRDVGKAFDLLLEALRMNHPDLAAYLQDFQARAQYLNTMICEAKDASSAEIGKSLMESVAAVSELILQIAGGDMSKLESVLAYKGSFDTVARDLILGQLETLGISSNAATQELKLMASKVDALQAQAAEMEGLESDTSLGDLGRLVATETRNMLKMTRNLGREAEAQSSYLAQMKQSMSNEKGLINAAMQSADACQMFLLCLELFKIGDKDAKYKVLAACQLLRQGLANILVVMLAKGGSGEISKRIEKIASAIYAKIEIIRTAAHKSIQEDQAAAGGKKTGAGGLGLIVQKRNAESLVVQRRRALGEAEEEVKRLNRAAARRV